MLWTDKNYEMAIHGVSEDVWGGGQGSARCSFPGSFQAAGLQKLIPICVLAYFYCTDEMVAFNRFPHRVTDLKKSIILGILLFQF